jgi:hypothetical protein
MKKYQSLLILAALSIATTAAHSAEKKVKGEKNIDQRERRQEHRIKEGIQHGQLTPDEVAKLQKQEASIKTMKENFEKDGKVTKDESKQLESALNGASLQIWAHRHDTEGNQKSESRLGKDIFANQEITQKIESGEMTHTEARDFLTDINHMVRLKRRLATEDLTDAQRSKLTDTYNDLLNQYFTVKE